MVMDLLRSCYSTKMRFFADSDQEIDVRWFWADEDAQIFPEHTRFGSGNWADEPFHWNGAGEVLGAPRPWNDGAPIDGLVGDHYCGPLATYQNGGTFPGVPLEGLANGKCACCAPLDEPPCVLVFPLYPGGCTVTVSLVSSNVSPTIYDAAQWPSFGSKVDIPPRWVIVPLFGSLPLPFPCAGSCSLIMTCIDDFVALNAHVSDGAWMPPDEFDEVTGKLVWHAFEMLDQACCRANGYSEKWRIELNPL